MQRLKFRSYWLHHTNRDAAESMIRQIDEFPSFFTPSDERPLIIDCGANIGVSVLEWKTRWPTSRILCFEPDPFAFAVLQMNIDANDIPDVHCINAAVLDHDETTTFYGSIGRGADARGNSVDAAWAVRDGTTSTEVRCKRLSGYIDHATVSFLKLDIEGAEYRVLKEILPLLDRVEAIYVEVHETDESVDRNSAGKIIQLLDHAGFTVEQETRSGVHALPPHLQPWQHRVGAVQHQLLCWR